jgi:hypothetical protein
MKIDQEATVLTTVEEIQVNRKIEYLINVLIIAEKVSGKLPERRRDRTAIFDNDM